MTKSLFQAQTPEPPYYAVIFTSVLSDHTDGYVEMAAEMFNLASLQAGFLGVESARNEIGITVSYWKDLKSIQKWKENLAHLQAKSMGKKEWYSSFRTRIAKVEKCY